MKAYPEHGSWFVKARVAPGKGGRLTLRLQVASEAEAQARAGLLGELLALLEAAGQQGLRERFARELAGAEASAVPTIERLCRKLARGAYAPAPVREILTVRQFGERWTSGKLAAEHPGIVRRRKAADKDAGYLGKWLYPLLGDLPLSAVRTEDCEQVARGLHGLRDSTRRMLMRIFRLLFSLAVWPGKQIRENPMPARLCAVEVDRRALAWLRTAEVNALLSCPALPVDRRLLWGVMLLEGLRPDEAVGLRWSHLDLEAGVLTLPRHKTERHHGARTWALGADVARAFGRWRQACDDDGAPWRYARGGLAERLRADLRLAGVTRPELHTTTLTSRAMRAHDCRGTFVVLASANGRSESWIMDRTGHTDSRTVGLYRRQARTAADLGQGWPGPLDVLVWGAEGADTPPPSACPQIEGSASGGLARTLPCRFGEGTRTDSPPSFVEGFEAGEPANDNCGQPADSPQACPWVVAGCDRRAA